MDKMFLAAGDIGEGELVSAVESSSALMLRTLSSAEERYAWMLADPLVRGIEHLFDGWHERYWRVISEKLAFLEKQHFVSWAGFDLKIDSSLPPNTIKIEAPGTEPVFIKMNFDKERE